MFGRVLHKISVRNKNPLNFDRLKVKRTCVANGKNGHKTVGNGNFFVTQIKKPWPLMCFSELLFSLIFSALVHDLGQSSIVEVLWQSFLHRFDQISGQSV